MHFDFTPEQNMLRESLGRLLQQKYTIDARKNMLADPAKSVAIWAELAEMGVMMAPLPEHMGGLGGDAIDALLVAEEMGKALVNEPYGTSVIVCGAVLAELASAEQQQNWGEQLTTGTIFALASAEKGGRGAIDFVRTIATKSGDGYRLSGSKEMTLGAPEAAFLIISARVEDAKDGPLALFVVPKDAKGLSLTSCRTVDGKSAADIHIDGVEVGPEALIGGPESIGLGAVRVLATANDFAILAQCAEAIGVMRVAHQLTMEYSKTRKQFGMPIAGFQVLQHRMVDMFVALEQSVSMTYLAAIRCREKEANARNIACAAAAVTIAQAARLIGQEAIQIHGGMGMTDEMAIGQYFKRLTMIEARLGGADRQLRRFAQLRAA